ncbi:hypothetical protein [Variovorax sp. WS11]|uniref:hypothetical protein n=1 Tax=Variovorax sp. WS11 TaxID=1105204 RepID=UPI0011B296FC|nr:hypothetical protein [Variovorax sp. WS11]NDZ13673.1 hypothetical protein [Variovorax sp. WS11]
MADAYRAMAPLLSKVEGIRYRYGDAPTVNNSGIPTLYKRADQTMSYHAGTWQVGGPVTGDAGLYSTNQAHVGFVADNPTLRMGVGDLQVSAIDHNTYSQAPQLPWQEAAAWDGSAGRTNFNVSTYKTAGLTNGDPVAVARCGGRTGFCATSIVAFNNGLIGTAGSNTANNRGSVKLPANKVPTGVAVTNTSEYALVTVWDTTALKGQVAVISLAGLCNNCDPYNSNGGTPTGIRNGTYDRWYDWWHEWMGVYPGLPNMGNIAFMKVLGYIDIPGMNAPTEIAVTTGFDQFRTALPEKQGEFMGQTYSPLTDSSKRASFSGSGSNANRYAKAGVAVVISKSEKKAAFIDLKPLFSYVNSVYFGTGPTEFTNLGQSDSQWPYTFAYKPQQTPTVISTVALDSRPTAVRTTLFGNVHRAWIATEEGSLRIYGLGNVPTGTTATDVVEKGRVAVGKNPTSLAISKIDPENKSIEPLNQQVLVASRGDRKIQWVRFASDGNSGSVVRTLQDSRMVDPIAVEDADNFASDNMTLSVADYTGKAVSNYRYGSVIFAGGGACPASSGGCPVQGTGGMNMEFGGSFTMEGRPFMLRTANVP